MAYGAHEHYYIKNLFNTISLLGIGAISLVVAGVSILNVMMMSTVERTKECDACDRHV